MPYLLIFSGLKPLPLNSLNPIKVTVPRDPFRENFDSGTDGPVVLNLCDVLWVIPLFTAMEQFIPELPTIEANTGAPWLWQVRLFQDDCVVILREIRGLRLQGGRYPSRNEHLSTCACDASLLVDMIETWDLGWQVPYVVLRIAARGLYAHPDVLDLVVQGVRVQSYVTEVLHYVNQRGYALGLLEAEVCGRYEPPWDREEPHPLVALQAMTEEVDAMARVLVERLMDEV